MTATTSLRNLLEERARNLDAEDLLRKYNSSIYTYLIPSINNAILFINTSNSFDEYKDYLILFDTILSYFSSGNDVSSLKPDFSDQDFRIRFSKKLLDWHIAIELLNNSNRSFESESPGSMKILWKVQIELKHCIKEFFNPLDAIFAFTY